MEFKSKFERLIFIIILVTSLIGGLFFGYVVSQTRNFSGIENLKRFQPNLPTKLYDVNGELIAELFQEKRDLIPFENLPENLINAFLATEDKDFYRHIGINPSAIIRAFFKNIAAGKVVQGGSTITQQLAKRLFTGGERTLIRKALEAVFTLQIEKKFSKEEILEIYFNQIYLGHGCYGVTSAAGLFFNKEVKDLSVAESSVLAALPSAPRVYSPLENPRNAYIKNRDILNRMVSAGFISEDKAKNIYNEFWPKFIESIKTEFPSKTASTRNIDNAPYFTDYTRQILLSRFGKDIVYNEGLSVYTTLNLKRQRLAQNYLTEGVTKQNNISSSSNKYTSLVYDKELFRIYDTISNIFSLPFPKVRNNAESQFNKKMIDDLIDDLDIIYVITDTAECSNAIQSYRTNTTGISSVLKVEGALIAIEPATGYITTMVGGSGFSVDNQYNRAVQARRQVGSAFKPFVYGAGIESKLINAATTLPDAPIVNIDQEGETWSPGNYKDSFSGLVRLRNALSLSINIISIRIFDIIGADTIIDFATKILRVPESRFTTSPSLALGVCGLTPLEIARGYAIFANNGKEVIPYAVRYVTDRDGNELANIEEDIGNLIAEKEISGSIQIIPKDVAFVMNSLMQSVVSEGTAHKAIRSEAKFTKPCAGKTGTTSNWTDAWFCGYTPDIAAVVWVGYDRPFMSLGKHQAGAVVAAPIWAKYMKDITEGKDGKAFIAPPSEVYGETVCAYTGLLPSPACVDTNLEFMIKGAGPSETCTGIHFKVKSILDRYIEKEGIQLKKD